VGKNRNKEQPANVSLAAMIGLLGASLAIYLSRAVLPAL
jgi:hypothetical protein